MRYRLHVHLQRDKNGIETCKYFESNLKKIIKAKWNSVCRKIKIETIPWP